MVKSLSIVKMAVRAAKLLNSMILEYGERSSTISRRRVHYKLMIVEKVCSSFVKEQKG